MKFLFYMPLCVFLFLKCSSIGEPVAGSKGGSETTNGVTASIFMGKNIPVANATVRLRPADYVVWPPSLSKDTALKYTDTTTENDGRFEITDIEPGHYRIEVSDECSSSVLFTFTITENEMVDLGAAALKPFASLKGRIGSPAETAYVQICGIERLIRVDSTGEFVIHDLPHGEYELRLAKLNGQSEEIAAIEAISGDTTQVLFGDTAHTNSLPRWRNKPDGFAKNTSGGGNASLALASTAAEFKALTGNNDSAVIIVDGKLDVGDIIIGSNKTIIGKDSKSGLYGGRIELRRGNNYIFQNLIFGPSGTDALEITQTTHVYIHKCEFMDAKDGLLDIVRQSDSITISWCKFYNVNYVKDGPIDGCLLIGNGDEVTADSGKLNVTMHHNWFAENFRSFLPIVHYGHVHMYNNFYNSSDSISGIGVGAYSRIRIENSVFEDIHKAWIDFGGKEKDGEIGWDGLLFDNTEVPAVFQNAYPVFEPPYPFDVETVDGLKEKVVTGAGNRVGDSIIAAESTLLPK